MAAWQFNLMFIPRGHAPKENGEVISLFDDDAEQLWLGMTAPTLMAILQTTLSIVARSHDVAWDPEMLVWGVADQTVVSLSKRNDRIVRFDMRLDMRSARADLPTACFRVARELDLVVATELGDIVEPEVELVLQAACRSGAAKFVRDPRGFLRGLKGKN